MDVPEGARLLAHPVEERLTASNILPYREG